MTSCLLGKATTRGAMPTPQGLTLGAQDAFVQSGNDFDGFQLFNGFTPIYSLVKELNEEGQVQGILQRDRPGFRCSCREWIGLIAGPGAFSL